MRFLTGSNSLRRLSVFVLALSVLPVLMAGDTRSSRLGNVALPELSLPENAKKCVEPVEIMRRDHAKFLYRQRDETVQKGIRTKKFSLVGCINCHAQANRDGEIVRSDNPAYFCTGCHIYTSVNIDCFECHSDRPVDLAYRGVFGHDRQIDFALLSTTGAGGLLSETALSSPLQPGEMCDA